MDTIKAILLLTLISIIPFLALSLLIFLASKLRVHQSVRWAIGILLGVVGLSIVNCLVYALGTSALGFMVFTGEPYQIYLMMLKVEYYVFFLVIIAVIISIKPWIASFWKFG